MALCRNCGEGLAPRKMLCAFCGHLTPNGDGVVAGGAMKEEDFIDATEVTAQEITRIVTGGPWDPVWGGGFVPSTCTLLGGPPGIGKTTILLQLSKIISDLTSKPTYYNSAEQHKGALKMTIDRMGLAIEKGQLRLLKSTGGGGAIDERVLDKTPPGMIILDSVSALCGNDKHMQVAVAKQYIKYGVKYSCLVFLIAHMTKEHDYAGLMALQHEVDTLVTISTLDERKINSVLRKHFGEKRMMAAMMGDEEDAEIEQFLTNLRALTPWKNRYGPTGQEHYVAMSVRGLIALPPEIKEKKKGGHLRLVPPPLPDDGDDEEGFEEEEENDDETFADEKPKKSKSPSPDTIEVGGQTLVNRRKKKELSAKELEEKVGKEAVKKRRAPMPKDPKPKKKPAKKTAKKKAKKPEKKVRK